MIYLSAGHHLADPGAIGNGYIERDLTIELRDLIVPEIIKLGGKVITDKDSETLQQYINRIKPGDGSVLCEPHFNASANSSATGAECLYPDSSTSHSVALSREISETISTTLSIRNRGAKSEKESARGRLAILRTNAGISCLPEICFIGNKDDMAAYQKVKHILAKRIAAILVKYDNMIK